MRAVYLFIALLAVSTPCHSVTVVRNVGHGDCYAVISDGRMIVIDAGPATSVEGLVSFIRQGYPHFDRVVITHVHSDHAGGLITAGQYARQHGSALSIGMLVSNHGEHDINLIIRDTKLPELMRAMREQPLVAMDDPATARLAFADENIEVERIALGDTRRAKGENPSSLVLKITEIRDGDKRAVLFLGDIEKSQQSALLSRPDAKEIFRNVRAITLPHHGRAATLSRNFLKEIRRLAGPGVVLLHSDRSPLDRRLAAEAAKAGFVLKSTAVEAGPGFVVDLFDAGKAFHVVQGSATKLADIVAAEEAKLIREGVFTTEELVDAVGKFSNRSAKEALPADTVMSWPTRTWLQTEIAARREQFGRETDRLIALLESAGTEESVDVERRLDERRGKMSAGQVSTLDSVLTNVRARRLEHAFNEETERLLVQLESTDMAASAEAEKQLSTRRAKLTAEQAGKFDQLVQKFNKDTDALIQQLQSLDTEEAAQAEKALTSRRGRLTRERLAAVDAQSKKNAARRQLESEILRGIDKGWRVEQNWNIDDSKLLVYGRGKGGDVSLRYVVKEVDYETWEVHRPGAEGRLGIATYGKKLGVMKRPASVNVTSRTLCEYCGTEAIGYCHKRNKHVCDDHRYFTQGGINWRCP